MGWRRTGRSSSTLEGKGVVALNETSRKEQVLKLPSGILISLVLGPLKVAGVAGVASREATPATPATFRGPKTREIKIPEGNFRTCSFRLVSLRATTPFPSSVDEDLPVLLHLPH